MLLVPCLFTLCVVSWGTMAVPFTNDETSFGVQFIGVAATAVFVIVTTSIVWLILKYTMGIRVSEEEEMPRL